MRKSGKVVWLRYYQQSIEVTCHLVPEKSLENSQVNKMDRLADFDPSVSQLSEIPSVCTMTISFQNQCLSSPLIKGKTHF